MMVLGARTPGFFFPAGRCLGCSWLRHAESCRCDLFICFHLPPFPPPLCLPPALLPCRAHLAHPTQLIAAARPASHPAPTPASPRCSAGGGLGWLGLERVCVCVERRGGGVNLILRGWKREKKKNQNYKEGSSLLLFPLPRSRGLSLQKKKRERKKKMSAAFC